MVKHRKAHGPRYSIKGKKKAWVTREAKGKFKKWTNKRRSLRVDKMWKAPKGTRPGHGARKDYPRHARRGRKKGLIESVLS